MVGRLISYLRGASEGNLVDVHVLSDGGSGGRAHAGQDVDDAFREAHLQTTTTTTTRGMLRV